MQIVVVEDNAWFARDVIRTLEEFFSGEEGSLSRESECVSTEQEKFPIRLKSVQIRYLEGTGLLEELEKGQCCDLCLLDVEMPGMDGITLAEKIHVLNKDVRIIFLTSYEKYAFPSYRVRADGYILKENYRKELLPVLQRICREEEEKQKEYYVIQTDTQGYKLRISDILYLEKDKKYTVFRCFGGREYRERDTLENVFGRLPQNGFVLIDKGIIVHLRHVVEYVKMTLTMRDGTVLAASRRAWPQVRERLHAYWEEW